MYITQTDLENRYTANHLLRLADRGNDGTIDSAVITAAITYAGGVIDGYLTKKYITPLTTPPQMIKDIAVFLAYYYLCQDQITDDTSKNYQQILTQLHKLATGELELSGIAKKADANPDDNEAVISTAQRQFLQW